MKEHLISFLNEYRIRDENLKATHQSWGNLIQGKFIIDKTNIKDFFNLYSSVVKNDHLSILEVQKEYSPILIDVDLKHSVNNSTFKNLKIFEPSFIDKGKRLYKKQDILKLIKIYYHVLNEFLDLNSLDYNFYIFEKSDYSIKDDIIKDGFHITIPEICTITDVRHTIRKRVVDICIEDKIFEKDLDTVDKIIDKSVVSSNGWFLYGSFKPSGLPYKLSKIYNNKFERSKSCLEEDDLIKYLSIHYKPKRYSEKNAIQVKNVINKNISAKLQIENKPNNENDITDILEHLDKSRFNNYDEWLKLYFIFVNENYDLDIFDDYSSSCSNYNKENNKLILKNIKHKSDGYTKSSLYYWLKEDNPEYFEELIVRKNDIYKLAENLTQNDLAKFYYNLEPYKYCRSDKTGWYEYNKFNILEPHGMKFPISLLNTMSDKIQDLFIKERNKYRPPLKEHCEDWDDANKKYKKVMKMFDTAYRNIGCSKFTKGCMDYLTNLYTVKNLDDKLDNNNNLLAFNDGYVFDMLIGDFRKIKSDDYITKTTKRNAPLNVLENKINEVRKLLWTVFEDNDIIDYWLKVFGCSLFTNKYESLYILTGSGRNGKGLLMDLVKNVLGDYFHQGEPTFLTSITKKGAPDSTKASCKGVRILSISEPDDGTDKCELNCNLIKSITGRDEIKGRFLYGNDIQYIPMFNLFLQCNDIPNIKKLDTAIIQRLKIIKYKFQFLDDPKSENDKLCDNTLKDKLKSDEDFKDAFLYLLIQYGKKSINEKNLVQPVIMKEITNNYIDCNNPIKTFLQEHFLITSDNNDKIRCSEFVSLFNTYSVEKLQSHKIHKDMAFNGFEIYTLKGIKYYKGIKLLDNNY
jgi:P4 family phage/plasmid primase-like protien